MLLYLPVSDPGTMKRLRETQREGWEVYETGGSITSVCGTCEEGIRKRSQRGRLVLLDRDIGLQSRKFINEFRVEVLLWMGLMTLILTLSRGEGGVGVRRNRTKMRKYREWKRL